MTVRALVAAILLLAVGCASEGSLRVIAPDELPEDVYASPSPSPTAAPQMEISIFFVRDGQLVEATRSVPEAENEAESALRALLTGPAPEDTARRLSTTIPRGAELLELEVTDGVASVDLSKEFELSADQRVLLQRLGQVVYTVTGASGVQRVRFLIDGEPANVIGDDGAAHDIVGRSDYEVLTRPPATATPQASPAPEG